MEESRCTSRVVVNDGVYDHIQQQRFKKHKETVNKLRAFDRKSNSHYMIRPHQAEQLDKAKRAQAQVLNKVFPPEA